MKNLYTAFLCIFFLLSGLTQSHANSFSSITGNTIGSDQTICNNTTPLALTGSVPGGGSFPFTYQWMSSTTSAVAGFTNIGGATAQGFAPGALVANRWYKRIAISGIERDTTSAVAITVTPVITPASNVLTGVQTICYNTIPATINGPSATGGNGIYAYQWQSSPDNVTFSNIPGANGTSYTPAALIATTWYKRIVSSGGCTNTSASIQVTVTPLITVGSNTITADQSICNGQIPLILNGSTPTGGSGAYTYLWESSTTSAVAGFSTAAGVSNGKNYTPPLALTQTTWYHRIVISGGCNDISSSVQITVVNAPPGNPAVFGNGVWNVYGYSDNAFGTYAGFYTEPILSFNTVSRYTNNQSPSSASGYQGCLIPASNFSASMKQTNFTPGNYQLNLNSLDDNLTVILNGTQIYTHGCCVAAPINNIWTGFLGATDQMELRWVGLPAPNYLSMAFVPVTPAPLVPGAIKQDLQVCYGEVPPSGFTSTAAPTSGCSTITMQWQKSIDNITWVPIAGATGLNYTETAALIQTTWYRRMATDACNNSAATVPVKVTVNVVAPGDPTVYGNNVWNVYVFQGTGTPGPYNAAIYKGYYTEPLLSFDSKNRWANTASPSNASGYQGCVVNVNNTWIDYKRANFTPAVYQIDIPYHDDAAYLFINGIQVFTHNGCCDAHTNVWTGPLGPTDQVEYRVSQGGGPSSEMLTLTPVTPPALTSGAITPDQTICAGNVPPTPLTEIAAPTGGCTIKNYTWEYSTDNGTTWNLISGATAINYTIATSIYTQTLYRRTVNDVCGNSAVSAPITIFMNNSAPGNPAVFGNNIWNVYCFQDVSYSIYAGYYTEPLLTFSTPNRYPATSPPSTASGYLGCQLINTFYSVSMKRTGFTAGLYQIDVTSDDDFNSIYINGVLVSNLNYPTIQNNVWTGNLGPSDQIEIRWRNNAGPGQTGVRFTLVTATPLVPGSIVAYNPNLCFNDLPIINEVTPASGGCFVNYSWQSSIDGGTTWTTVAGATGNSFTATVSPTTNIQYRRVATDVCGTVAYSAPVSFIQAAGTVGNPAVFGNGIWNVYAYNAPAGNTPFSAAQYLGYYTEPLLSFDSRNRWNSAGSPSDASGYQGCQVDQENHWVAYKRTNFAAGTYQLDVAGHDDDGYLFINGVLVWSHIGCCDVHNNVWTGVLGPTDQIEFRWRDYFGGSLGALNFTLVTPATSIVPGTIAADQIICSNTIPVAFTSTLDASSSCFVYYQWQSSPDNATWSDISGATSNVYASGAVAAKTYFRRKATNACSVTAYSNTVTVDVYPVALTAGVVSADQSFCKGTIAAGLTSTSLPTGGNGVYTYQWQSSLDNIGWSNIGGATLVTYAPGSPVVTTYYRRVASSCGTALTAASNVITITVNQLPTITTQPNTPSACTGGSTTMTVAATGSGITYQWQEKAGAGPFTNLTNVAPYSGVNTATLTLNPVTAGMAGNKYQVIISSPTCAPAVTSNTVILAVAANPSITTQPASKSFCEGTNATVSIVASGTGLTYQWQRQISGVWTNLVDDATYNGTLTSVLTINNVLLAMNSDKNYRVLLGSSCAGSLTSNTAAITVVAALVNTISADQTFCTGIAPAPLTGSAASTYQWQSSTVSPVSGFVNASGASTNIGYTPPILAATTYYQRIAGNGTCTSTSNVVTMTLNNATITITGQPANQDICAGGIATFTGTASGPGTLSYQWYENVTPIVDGGIYSGSTTNTLTLTGATAGMNNNTYTLRVFASGCSASFKNSAAATLTTVNPPVILTNAASFTTCQGSGVQLNMTAGGIGITYQWQVNTGSGWNNLSNFGAYSNVNGNSLRINPTASTMDGYQYRVIVSGTCSPFTATSAVTTMNVNSPVTNNTISNSQTLCAGTPAPFTGSTPTGGTGTYTYQWYLNSNGTGWFAIGGATGINYSSGPLSLSTQFYRMVTSGACASTNSPAITVTVQPPTSTTDPSNTTVCAGTNASFSVIGTGTGLSYQWQANTGSGWSNIINGASYTGVTTATLTVVAPPFGFNGYQYRCIVGGNCAPVSVTSAAATLTVNPVAIITSQPSNVITCAGSSATYSVTATGAGLSYQWMEKVGAGAFTNITDGGIYSGATTATLTLTGVTVAMNNNQYMCVITAGSCPVNSLIGSLIVNAQPTLVITNPPLTCALGTVDITAAAITAGSNLAGGILTYWNNLTFTSPVSSPSAISVAGTYYIRVATSAVCYDVKPVVVSISTSITNNTISASQAICTGTAPAALTGGAPGGGTGAYSYQWQSSTDNITYGNIGGAVNPGFAPGALAVTTWYRRIVSSGTCSNTSPPVQITVVPYPTASISYAGTPFCATGLATVTQSGQTGGVYSAPAGVSINAATGTINLALSTAGTYSIVYNFSNGTCSGSTNTSITINGLPSATISYPGSPYCAAGTATVTLSGTTGGTYSAPAGLVIDAVTGAVNLSASTLGSYLVSYAYSNGTCSNIATAPITINALPTAAIVYPGSPYCSTGTATVSQSGQTGGSYSALPAGLSINAVTGDINLSASTPSATPYTVTYSFTNGVCSNTTTTNVTINAFPNLVITNPAAVCSPATINLTAAAVTAGSTAGLTFTYFTDAAGTIALATPAAVAASGTYYIKGTTAAGCADIKPVVVTINPKPTVTITNPAAVCAPGTVDITTAAVTTGSTAGLTFTYFTDAAGTIVLATPAAVAASGTYYIKGTLATGCSDIKPVVVTINPKPTVTITNPAAVCSPATVNITAAAVTTGSTAGLTFTYFTDAAGTIVLATPAAVATSGTYYIKGTLATGCSDIKPVVVTINPKPTVTITNPAAVCAPGTADITAAAVTTGSTAGLTFTYFTDAAGTIVLATPAAVAASGTYYIKGTLATGCSDIKPVVVTINPKATVTITNPAAVCSPATVNITAAAVTAGSTAGLIFSYFTDAAGTIVLATPAAVAVSGTYYIKGTLATGCSDIKPVVVTINPKPTVTITNPAAVCSPATVNITVAAVTTGSTAGLTFTYFTDAAGTIVLATPAAVAASGTYYIKGTTAAGCFDIQPVVVTINPKPTVVITNPAAACSPSTVDITVAAVTTGSTAGLTFTYFTDAAGTIVLATPAAVATSGTYYIKGTLATGCSDIKPVVVTINPKPTVTITNPAAVCSPATVNITAAAVTAGSTAGLTFTYFTDAAGTIVLATPAAVATSGTYYIKGTLATGCSDIKLVVVTINPKPTVTVTNPAAVCAPGTVDITAAAVTTGSTAGLTFTYFTDAAGTIVLATPAAVAASGTYYIKGTLATGCSDIKPVVVTINPKPTVTITNPAAVCSPATVDITVAAVTTGSTAGLTFTYFTDAAGTIALATPAAVATSGTYYIKGTLATGCSDIKPVVVTINPKPTVTITNPAAVCAPATVNITTAAVTTGSTAGLTFTYFTDAAGTIVLATPAAVAASGTYYIKGTTASGCSDIKPVVVTINPKPTVTITNPAAVCAPGTVDITAAAVTTGSTAGLTFTYFTDAAGTIVLATPAAVATSGTYYIKGTLATGCSDIKPVVVTINPKPTVTITNPAAVCAPGTVDITVAAVTTGSTAGLTFTYFTDAAGTIVLATPAAVAVSGTYYIKGTTASGCSDIKPVVVTINPKPTVTITNPAAVCSPATVDITVAAVTTGSTAGLTFTYFTDAAGTIVLATPAAVATSGTYYIKGTLATGCSDIKPVVVTINPKPTVVVTNPAAVCSPATVDITAAAVTTGSTAGLTFTYFTDAAGTIVLATPAAVATSGTYYIKGTLASGCSDIKPVVVTINPKPTVTITNPAPVCAPGTVDITAAAVTTGSTAGLTFTYFSDAAGTIALATPAAIASSGTYYIRGTLATGCSDIKPVVVTINPKPTVTITNPAAVCSPATVDITAAAVTTGSTAGLTFTYFTDAAGTVALASPAAVAASGTYYIKGTLATGCSDIKPVVVTINPKPTVTITNPASVCAPGTVDITVAAVTSGSTAGLTFTYFTDAAGTIVLATPSAVATSGTYYIKGTLATGCSDIKPVVVTINPKPTVTITNPAAVCAPGTVDITTAAVTTGSTAGLTFTYFTDAAGTIVLATPNAITTSGTYYIKGTLATGCSDIKPVVVTINPKPTVVITNPVAVCAPGTVDITVAAITTGSTAGLTFTYFTDAAGTIALPTPAAVATSGTYYIKGTLATGCSDIKPVTVTINPKPTVTVTNPPAVCSPGTVDITAAAVTTGSTAGLTFTYFTDAAGTIVLATPNAVAASGTYYIKGSTVAGCSDIKPVVVTINPLPTATINYTASPYCATGTATVTRTGQAGGTYTAPGAVSINAVTGDINLATSTPGTYTVTYSYSNGTCSSTTPATITINALPTATIAYTGSPYCATGTATVTQAGQAGGTYTALPAGLSINASTGAINLALSTPSATPYTITYAFGNGTCSNSTTTTVLINALPTIVITNPAAVCAPGTVDITTAAVTTGSTAGLTFTYFTDAAGTVALATPAAVAASGTYYIKGTLATGCSDIKPVVVTINPKPTVVITNPVAVCAPGTVDITAAAVTAGSTAGLTFTYFTDAAGTIVLATPAAIAASGTYYIKGTLATGCSDIKPVVVTINPKPTVVITNPVAICAPGTDDITVAAVTTGSTAGLTFTYFTDAAGTIVLATPAAVATSGTYYIKGTLATGCSDIKPVVVTINPKPTVVITNPAAVCAPGTVDITVAAVTTGSTAGLTFTYFTDAAGTIVLATPNAVTTSGTYYIKGSSAAGCSDIKPVVVTINPKPTVTITNPVPVCSPATVDITAAAVTTGSTAGLTFTYFTDAAGTIVLATPNAVTTSGTYYIKGSSAAGCSDIKPVLVTINLKPTVVVTNPPAACSPATVDLTAAAVTTGSTAGLTFTYFTDAAGTIVLATPNAVAASGTYYIKGATAAGCSDIQPVVVTINPKPAVVITNPAPVCAPATIDITTAAVTTGSTAGLTFTYFTDAAGTIVLATPAAIATSGTYYIKGTLATGCSDIKPVVVTINPLPAATINYAGSPYCATGTATVTQTGLTGGTYAAVPAGLSLNSSTGDVNLVASTPGIYTVTYSFTNGTCNNTNSTSINIITAPSVVITNPAMACTPGTVDLTAASVTAGSTPGLTYTYFTDAAGTVVLAGPNAIAVSGTYYIKGSAGSGCSDIKPVVVTINPKPTVVVTNPAAVCSPATVDITSAAVTTGSTAGLTFTYFTDAAGTIVLAAPNAIAASGTYYIKGSTVAGCSDIKPVVVTINPLPLATINYAGSPYCATGTATVTRTGQSGGTYTAPGAVVIDAITGDINLATSTPGTYTVTYSFSNGTCSSTTPATITINALPTATINYAGSPYCATGTATVTRTGQAGGTYTALPAGLSINASTGDINLSASTPSATPYTVTYAFGNGTCSNSTTTTILINALPTIVITNPAAVCLSSTVDITAAAVTTGSTAGLTFTYFTDAAGTIVLATPNAVAASGTFYIKGTLATGCSDIKPVTVTINPKPTVTITNPAAVCAPGTIDITTAAVTTGSTAGLTFTYFTDAAGTIVLATPAAITLSGTYYIKGTLVTGCSDIKPVVVTINPKPTVTITNPAAVCGPGTVDITAAAVTTGSTAGLTFTYFTDAAGTIILATPAAITTSGTYYIKGTTAAGCSDIKPVVVTINPKPTVTITNPAAVCSPATVDITASAVTAGSTAGLTFTYFTDAAGTIALATPNAVATSGTYYIKGSTAAGCSDIKPIVVTINPKPTIVVTNPAAVCAPGTVDITAAAITTGSTAGLIFTYFTDAAGTIVLATPAAVAISGTYYIKGSTAAGCSDIQPVTVTINPKPAVVITNPAPLCAPATVDITAAAVTTGCTAGLTFTYFTDAAGTIVLATPNAVTASGTYYIKGSTVSGCSDIKPVVVTINPLPTATIAYSASPYCATGTATVTRTGQAGGTYTAPAAVVIDAVTGDINLAASTPGTYTITYSFSNGTCSSTTPATITINALPAATISYAGSPYCATGTATVTQIGQAGGTYTAIPAGLSINASTGDINLSASTPSATPYTVTYSFSNGTCSNSTTTTVMVITLPTVTITNPTAVCSPATVDITAGAVTTGSTAGLTYTYFTDAAGTISLATPAAVSASGTYYIKGLTAAGCSDIKPVVVTINPKPAVVVTNPAAICAPGTVDITAAPVTAGSTAGLTFTYFTDAAGTIVLATPAAVTTSGTYYIKGSTASGCSDIKPVIVTINPKPTVVITNPGAVCAPGTVDITAVAVTTGSTAGLTFTYFTDAAGTIGLATPNAVAASGTYYIKGSTAAGCSDIQPVTVTINPKPTVTITNPAAVCAPGTVDITAGAVTTGSTVGLTFTYFSDAAGTIVLATPNAITTSGTYYIKGTLATGCSDIQPVVVTINPKPTVTITNPVPVCAPATVDITAAAVTTGSTAGLTYTYFTDAAGTIVLATPNAVTASGTYYIKGSTVAGCSDIKPVVVTINPLPTATIAYGGSPYCATGTATVTRTGQAGGTYTAPAAVSIDAVTGDINLAASTPGTYTVTYSFSNGTCSSTTPATITINALPTATINYAGSPYCATGTATVTQIGQTGGTYTALPAGLSINASTGAIDLSLSTPSATPYTVTYSFSNGTCSNSTTTTVLVNPIPTIVITNPAAVCAPGTVDITTAAVTTGSTAGLTYAYFTDAAGTIVLVTPNAVATSGTYYIKGSTAAGCSDIKPVVVTINPKPTVTITNPAPVCAPATVDITAAAVTTGSTAGLTFTYFTDAAGTIVLATPNAVTTSGTYYIKGSTAAGCTDIQPVTVAINPKPTVVIVNPPAACPPATVDITAAAVTAGSTAGLTFTYFMDAGGTISLANANAIAVAGTYYIMGTTAAGCSDIQPVTVSFNALPTASISYTATPYCATGTATVARTGQAGGTYTAPAAVVIDAVTGDINLAASTPGTYTVTYSFSNGTCSSTTPAPITINALPTATIAYTGSPYCATGTATVTQAGQAGGTYTSIPAGLSINASTGAIDLSLSTPSATPYTVTYSFSNGTCSNSITTTVLVNPLPTIVITNPTAVCAPATVDITAAAVTTGSTAGLTFTYFTDAAGTIVLVTPNAITTSGTYYIKGTLATGCSDIQPVIVTINPKPTVTITSPAAVCSPATVDITTAAITSGSTAGLTFTYFTDAAGTIALATPNAVAVNGTYYIMGTTAAGCSDIQPVVVTINPKPSVVVANPAPVCPPATVDITAAAITTGSTAGLTFTYFTDAAGTLALANANAIAVAGTYYIKGSTAAGCSDIQPVTVSFNALPAATIAYNASPYCNTGVALVSLTGQTGGFFTAPFGVVIDNLTGAIDLGASPAGTYQIDYTSSNGICSGTTSASITINALPVAVISYPGSPYCASGTAAVTQAGQSGGTYSSTAGLVIDPVTGTINLASSTPSATPYTVKYVFGNGTCTNSTTTLVIVKALPVSTIAYTASPYCTNGTAIVTLTGTGGGAFAATPAGLSLNGVTGDINLAASAEGSYTVTYNVTSAACSYNTSTPVVIKNPALVISTPAPVCSPGTVDLTVPAVTSGSAAGLTYSYYLDNAGTVPLVNPATVGTGGNYFIRGFNASTGCSTNLQPVVVNILTKPSVTASSSTNDICKGTMVTLTAVSPGNTIDWPGVGAGNVVTVSPLDSTIYLAVATSPQGCMDTTTVNINVNGFKLALTANPDPVLAGTNTTLTTSGNFTYNVISWSPDIFFTDQTAMFQNIIVKDTSKSFTVIAQSIDGCLDTATLFVQVDPNLKDFFIPNSFSPNGDGTNDIFKVYGSSVKDVSMRVYNQWGQLIFESQNASSGWDGTWNGRPQMVGVYVYVAQVTFYNGIVTKRKGTINLIR